MGASWPASKKTFTQVVNGITKLVALLFNTGYDEIEAMQTFIGESGNAQSKNATMMDIARSLTNLLPKISWIDADTIEIEAKTAVMFSGNNYVIKRNTSAIQIKLSEDLDTGAEAASTRYYVWLTGDSSDSTYSACFSLSDSAPTGYTYAVCIGQVCNDGASDLEANSMERYPIYEKFGEWETKSNNTVYQANCDGEVVANQGTSGKASTLQILTDGSNPPTTVRQNAYTDFTSGSHNRNSATCPVRKGDYWKTTDAVNVFWISKNVL